jgi:hypothetical protein
LNYAGAGYDGYYIKALELSTNLFNVFPSHVFQRMLSSASLTNSSNSGIFATFSMFVDQNDFDKWEKILSSMKCLKSRCEAALAVTVVVVAIL